MRDGNTQKVVDYLDGFQTEERGSRMSVKIKSIVNNWTTSIRWDNKQKD
ncbi:hypothetical protein [Moheibacter sp.]